MKFYLTIHLTRQEFIAGSIAISVLCLALICLLQLTLCGKPDAASMAEDRRDARVSARHEYSLRELARQRGEVVD